MIIRNEVIKIGYLSFDASVKIHYSGKYTSTKTGKSGNMGIAGYIRHIDRSTDKMNGCEVQHGNPDINSDLTLENESYYKDSNGEWQRTSHSKDMVNAINRRIEYAKEHGARISTKGKNDTVIVRPLVLQMGNDSITGHENTWMWDLIGILEEEFGTDNITGFSIHKDETNPHIHVSFVACHETDKDGEVKCSISQTKFFKNPKQLSCSTFEVAIISATAISNFSKSFLLMLILSSSILKFNSLSVNSLSWSGVKPCWCHSPFLS